MAETLHGEEPYSLLIIPNDPHISLESLQGTLNPKPYFENAGLPETFLAAARSIKSPMA